MLIQKVNILCKLVLREPEDRILYIVEHINQFYDEFRRYKTDKQGNKRKNKPQYVAKYGEYWSRTINPPITELKTIQKRINAYLVEHIQMPNYAFGGVKGKDNIQNARFHKGQKYVFQTDLKDFFPFITNKMVYAMFVMNGFSPDVASILTKLTTFKGHLPQGSPSSTTIANLVFAPVGAELQSIAKREDLRFTTFVDDVTMSAQRDFKEVVPEIIERIRAGVPRGFKVSQGKTTYKSGITDITGVKMLNNSMTITDKLKAKIDTEADENSLRARGMRNYAKRVAQISTGNNKSRKV